MSKSIRISDTLIAEAERVARAFHRSPPQQVEHWAQLGRIMETALSWKAQSNAKAASMYSQLEDALASVDTVAGLNRSHNVIRRTSVMPCGYE